MNSPTQNGKNNGLKLVFGLAIFLFSLALAYFAASYAGKTHGDLTAPNGGDIYWFSLAVAGIIYVIAGILVSSVYPISFGFLFSADVVILHLFFENFSGWENVSKALITAALLCALYAAALLRFSDDQTEGIAPPAPAMPKGPETGMATQ